ncbi:MAG TPA: ABC transporter permease [Streptosporangiaceae bacterium]|nr:ABC transporter permease [Streptosporangiaceae bacterium]
MTAVTLDELPGRRGMTGGGGSGMGAALRIEIRKLTTTRTWWVLGLVAIAVAVLVTVLTVAGASSSQHAPLEIFTGALIGGVQTAYMITAIVGITAVAGEYRHRTATSSYLAIPRRGRLISAKLLVLAGYGLIVGVMVVGICSAIAAPWLSAQHLLNGTLTSSGVARAVIGGTAAIAVMTAVGVAVGALLRNQIVAVGALLVYLFAIEQTINNISATRAAYPYLPGGAVQSLAFSGHRAFGSPTGAILLSPWAAAAVIIGYAIIITAIAVRTSIRRDVT